MEGGAIRATHRPQNPAIGTGAIIDVNGIKGTSWVIFNAVIRAKEEQWLEFKARNNKSTVVSGHRGFLHMLTLHQRTPAAQFVFQV